MKKFLKKITCVALATITVTSLVQGSMKEVFLADEVFSVKTAGYENGKGLDLNKLGSYITGTSNKDGGVSEIISYDSKNNKAWAVNGATGLIDVIDLSYITSATSSEMPATSIDVKAIVEGKAEGFTYGDMTSVSVHAESGFEKFDASRAELVSAGVMLAKDVNPSTDLEPEYIATTNETAYVALQEANAIAVLDLTAGKFTNISALGYKDKS